jgi:hypothetical protein
MVWRCRPFRARLVGHRIPATRRITKRVLGTLTRRARRVGQPGSGWMRQPSGSSPRRDRPRTFSRTESGVATVRARTPASPVTPAIARRFASSSRASCATTSQRPTADARSSATARRSSTVAEGHVSFGPMTANSRALATTRVESSRRESTVISRESDDRVVFESRPPRSLPFQKRNHRPVRPARMSFL